MPMRADGRLHGARTSVCSDLCLWLVLRGCVSAIYACAYMYFVKLFLVNRSMWVLENDRKNYKTRAGPNCAKTRTAEAKRNAKTGAETKLYTPLTAVCGDNASCD